GGGSGQAHAKAVGGVIVIGTDGRGNGARHRRPVREHVQPRLAHRCTHCRAMPPVALGSRAGMRSVTTPVSIGSESWFSWAMRIHCVASPSCVAAMANRLPPATVMLRIDATL